VVPGSESPGQHAVVVFKTVTCHINLVSNQCRILNLMPEIERRIETHDDNPSELYFLLTKQSDFEGYATNEPSRSD